MTWQNGDVLPILACTSIAARLTSLPVRELPINIPGCVLGIVFLLYSLALDRGRVSVDRQACGADHERGCEQDKTG